MSDQEPIRVVTYDPAWPTQFEAIKAELTAELDYYNAQYVSIEHIGSTSIPELAAKPVLDIVVVIADDTHIEDVRTGLRHAGYQYIGDGGVLDRLSFKMIDVLPYRSLYVVLENSLTLRSHLDLKKTLMADEALRIEYGETKMALSRRTWEDVMEYSTAKNDIIRKILQKAGWTSEEVDEKERRCIRRARIVEL